MLCAYSSWGHCIEWIICWYQRFTLQSCVFSLHRSSSQISDEFDSFINHLEKILADISSSNPHFALIMGDFNLKSSNSWSNDTTIAEDAQLDHLKSLYGMKQVITEPTHIWKVLLAACILSLPINQTLLWILE